MVNKTILYPEVTLSFIAQRFFTNLNFDGGKLPHDDVIMCHTEAEFEGNLIRAHPNYQGEGECYDWISIICETQSEPAVGKVLMIFDFRKQDFLSKEVLLEQYGDTYVPSADRVANDIYLLMKFADDNGPTNIGHCNTNKKLRLMKRQQLDQENKFDLVPLKSFHSKELVFQDTPCVPFSMDEKNQMKEGKQITRNDHVSNLNRILPVNEWVKNSFLSNPLPVERRQNSRGGSLPYYMTDIDVTLEEIVFVTNSKGQLTSSKRGTSISADL
jgi:hypothetical protein